MLPFFALLVCFFVSVVRADCVRPVVVLGPAIAAPTVLLAPSDVNCATVRSVSPLLAVRAASRSLSLEEEIDHFLKEIPSPKTYTHRMEFM